MNSMYDILNKMKLLEGRGSKPDFLDIDKDGDRKEPMKKAAKEVDESVEEGSTGDYSAKKARAGKDIGKPGKQFAKIAKGAAERYGSKERGEKVAGAVLAKLRKEGINEADQKPKIIKKNGKPVGEVGIDPDAPVGRPGQWYMKHYASGQDLGGYDSREEAMSELKHCLSQEVNEADMEEGNDFTKARLDAIRAGRPTFKVDGKTYRVTGDTRDERQQVDEISTDLLARAADSAYNRSLDSERKGHTKAASIYKKQASRLDKAFYAKDKAQRQQADVNSLSMAKRRKAGLAEEDQLDERQQVDELSPGTVRSYAGKAIGDRHKSNTRRIRAVQMAHGGDDSDQARADATWDKETRNIEKRTAGLKRAAARLTKEGQLDEREYGQRDDFDKYGRPGDTIRTTKGTLTKTATGVKHERRPEDEEDTDADRDDSAPKKRGRPAGSKRALGAKGPTGRSKLLKKGAIREGDLEEDQDLEADAGEFGREGDMAKEQLHTIEAAAEELASILSDEQDLPEWVQKKVTLAMDYIDTARDYMLAQGGEEPVAEVAPPGAKAERMVKHIKKAYARDGKLTDREKAIAYATAWKAKKAGKVEEVDTGEADARKTVPSSKDEQEKVFAKHRARVEKEKQEHEKSKKEKSVEETTTAGSVATAPAAAPKGKKGMVFGKGVYEGQIAESFNKKLDTVLTEGMNINMSMDAEGHKSLSVSATDEDAVKLAQILRLAGMDTAHDYHDVCPGCGQEPCGCEQELEEADLANSPDEQYADTDTMVNTLSGGLNGRKSTGQSTLPVVNRNPRRTIGDEMASIREETEQRLANLYQKYKG